MDISYQNSQGYCQKASVDRQTFLESPNGIVFSRALLRCTVLTCSLLNYSLIKYQVFVIEALDHLHQEGIYRT